MQIKKALSEALKGPICHRLLQLGVGLGLEAGDIDDEALVGALADNSMRILSYHFESQPTAVYSN